MPLSPTGELLVFTPSVAGVVALGKHTGWGLYRRHYCECQLKHARFVRLWSIIMWQLACRQFEAWVIGRNVYACCGTAGQARGYIWAALVLSTEKSGRFGIQSNMETSRITYHEFWYSNHVTTVSHIELEFTYWMCFEEEDGDHQ